MELTTKMIQQNLAYYLSKHTPMTEQQVNEQFEEWLLAFVENIIEVRENQIIKLLEEPYFLEPLVKALNTLSDLEFKLPDGNDVVEMNFARQELYEYTQNLIALIKGEK